MIKLEDDNLTFTFPEVARQLTPLLERHIQDVRPKLRLPEHWRELVDALKHEIAGTNWQFRFWCDASPPRGAAQSTAGKKAAQIPWHKAIRATAEALTEADVDKALRDATYEAAGLRDDSLASVTISF